MKPISLRSYIPQRVQSILTADLIHPPPEIQQRLIGQIRHLSYEESEVLYKELQKKHILKKPFPLIHNDIRRERRTQHYVEQIERASKPYLKDLGKGDTFCDLGCGTGLITVGVLKDFIHHGGKVSACDVTNYVDKTLKNIIHFTQQDTFLYLKYVPTASFNGIMSVVMLHHLSSREKVRICIKEIARVMKPGGLFILVETAHHTWPELLKNAVLDKLLNERTNKELKCEIPTPLTFFSNEEICILLQKYGLRVLKKTRMKATAADPKFHIIYICQRENF